MNLKVLPCLIGAAGCFSARPLLRETRASSRIGHTVLAIMTGKTAHAGARCGDEEHRCSLFYPLVKTQTTRSERPFAGLHRGTAQPDPAVSGDGG